MNPFPTLSWTPGADEHQERGWRIGGGRGVTKPLTHIEYPWNGTDGFGHQETRMMKALEQTWTSWRCVPVKAAGWCLSWLPAEPRSKVRRPCTDHVGPKGEGSCQKGETISLKIYLHSRITNGGRLRVKTFAWARFRLKNGVAYQNEGSGGCDLAPFQKHATMTGPERKPGQLVVTGTLFSHAYMAQSKLASYSNADQNPTHACYNRQSKTLDQAMRFWGLEIWQRWTDIETCQRTAHKGREPTTFQNWLLFEFLGAFRLSLSKLFGILKLWN